MKINVLDKNGKTVEEMSLSKEVFGVVPNKPLLAQYIRVFRANQRQGTSSIKTRGEVSGGGKKPWKQKGTGRARVGSSRNPLWVHGGISHGPKPKDWGLKLPKKMRRAAIVSALSSKQLLSKITILDNLELKETKTKLLSNILDNLKLFGSVVLILDKKNDLVKKSAGNLNNLNLSLVENLNAYDILSANNVLFLKDAVLNLEKKYKKPAKEE